MIDVLNLYFPQSDLFFFNFSLPDLYFWNLYRGVDILHIINTNLIKNYKIALQIYKLLTFFYNIINYCNINV